MARCPIRASARCAPARARIQLVAAADHREDSHRIQKVLVIGVMVEAVDHMAGWDRIQKEVMEVVAAHRED